MVSRDGVNYGTYTMFSGDSANETQNLIASFGFVIMFKLERIQTD